VEHICIYIYSGPPREFRGSGALSRKEALYNINAIVSYCAKHNQHANARGVWGHGGMPPKKIDVVRLNLGAF